MDRNIELFGKDLNNLTKGYWVLFDDVDHKGYQVCYKIFRTCSDKLIFKLDQFQKGPSGILDHGADRVVNTNDSLKSKLLQIARGEYKLYDNDLVEVDYTIEKRDIETLIINYLNNDEINSLSNFNILDKKVYVARVKKAIEDDPETDLHQKILNIGYNLWKDGSYKDAIMQVEEEYGEFIACMILLGKYNQQVCNGGHRQYYSNGYADGNSYDCSDRDFYHPLHKKMMHFVQNIEEEEKIGRELKDKLYLVMKVFDIADIDKDKTVIEQEEILDDDFQGTSEFVEVEVENADYGMFLNNRYIEKMDKNYYAINDYLLIWYKQLIYKYLYN